MRVIAAGQGSRPIALGGRSRSSPILVLAGMRGPAGPGGSFPDAPSDGQQYARQNSAWSVVSTGGVASFNGRTGIVQLTSGDVSTALGFTPISSSSLAAVATSGSYIDLLDTPTFAAVALSGDYADLAGQPFIPTVYGDVGAASAAQGAKADTAVQPAGLASALGDKVDKVTGYGLSQTNFSQSEKDKLAGLESSKYRGQFVSLAALQTAIPIGGEGWYARIDAGAGAEVDTAIWDTSDAEWVVRSGGGGDMTDIEVMQAYERNADRNPFTDADVAKLGGMQEGATNNPNTDSLIEGSTNLYHTAARVLSVVLAGLSLATGSAVVSGDSILVAIGKLQKQVSDLSTSLAGKLTNPMTAAADLIVGGAAGAAQRLAAGSNGQVLKMVSGAPAWATEAGGTPVVQSLSSALGALDLSSTTAPVILVTLSENITNITLPAGVAAQSIERRSVFTQGGAGTYTVAGWPTLAVEGGGVVPAAGTGVGVASTYVLANDNNVGWRLFLDQGALVSLDSGSVGFVAGAGGAVTQATNKSTGVTLNKPTGKITLNAASLAASTAVSFTLTNNKIADTDVVNASIASGANAGAYVVQVDAVAAGSCRISLRNLTAAALAEAVILNFNVIKGAST